VPRLIALSGAPMSSLRLNRLIVRQPAGSRRGAWLAARAAPAAPSMEPQVNSRRQIYLQLVQLAVGLLNHGRDVSQRSLVSGHFLEVLRSLCSNKTTNTNEFINEGIMAVKMKEGRKGWTDRVAPVTSSLSARNRNFPARTQS